MSSFPAPGYLTASTRTEGETKISLEDFLASTKQLPGGNAFATLTIASDQITPTRFLHKIDTEAGGATDDLKQILPTNLPDGALLKLSIVSAARTVRLWNSAGGFGQVILRSGDHFWLGDPAQSILLQRNSTTWEEIERFPDANEAPHITKSAENYTITYADRGKSIIMTSGSGTFFLPDTVLAGKGFDVFLVNSGLGIITVDPAGTDTIDGSSTIKLMPKENIHAYCDGAAKWVALSRKRSRPARGYLFGMTLANDTTDATNDIQVAIGECASDDMAEEDRVLLSLDGVTIKRGDATWVAGAGSVGGRVGGAWSDGTWYIFAFRRGSDGLTDVIISDSLGPTLPDSGTHKRYLGSIRRVAGVIIPFLQFGDSVDLGTPILDVNDTATGTAAKTATLSVPAGVSVFAKVNVLVDAEAGSAITVYLSDLAGTSDSAPSETASPLGTLGINATTTNRAIGNARIRTNTSGQIRYRTSVDGTCRIALTGWIDDRGRSL